MPLSSVAEKICCFKVPPVGPVTPGVDLAALPDQATVGRPDYSAAPTASSAGSTAAGSTTLYTVRVRRKPRRW